MATLTRPLRIGITASHFPPDPERNLFRGKRLLYAEESLFRWVLRAGAVPLMLPSVAPDTDEAELVVQTIDGLLLSGGTDVAPERYGETPLKPEWAGDPYRDEYEFQLVAAARQRGIPILAICRGAQVLNVAMGGSLYQDIQTQIPNSLRHRDPELYDRNGHTAELVEGGVLARVYGTTTGWVNSVHHQSVKKLGEGLRVEATCPNDGVIEAFAAVGWPFALGLQWHPEFFNESVPENTFAAGPVRELFLTACTVRAR